MMDEKSSAAFLEQCATMYVTKPPRRRTTNVAPVRRVGNAKRSAEWSSQTMLTETDVYIFDRGPCLTCGQPTLSTTALLPMTRTPYAFVCEECSRLL